MGKELSDEEFDKVLEEQFLREADMIEKLIFSEERDEIQERSEEEVHASYEKLVARLKERGEFREEKEYVISEKYVRKSVYLTDTGMRHKRIRIAGLIAGCIIGVCIGVMTWEMNEQRFCESIAYLSEKNY